LGKSFQQNNVDKFFEKSLQNIWRFYFFVIPLLLQTNDKVKRFLPLVVVTTIMKNLENILRIVSIIIMASLGTLLIVDGFAALSFEMYAKFFATMNFSLGGTFIWFAIYAIICEIRWYRR
jgi:hypothetical protein